MISTFYTRQQRASTQSNLNRLYGGTNPKQFRAKSLPKKRPQTQSRELPNFNSRKSHFKNYISFLHEERKYQSIQPANKAKNRHPQIIKNLANGLKSVVKNKIVFSKKTKKIEKNIQNHLSFTLVEFQPQDQSVKVIKDNTAFGLQKSTFKISELLDRLCQTWKDFLQLDRVHHCIEEINKMMSERNIFRQLFKKLEKEQRFQITPKDIFAILRTRNQEIPSPFHKKKLYTPKTKLMNDTQRSNSSIKKQSNSGLNRSSAKALNRHLEDLIEMILMLEKTVLVKREEYLNVLKNEFSEIQKKQIYQRRKLINQFNVTYWKKPWSKDSYDRMMQTLSRMSFYNLKQKGFNVFEGIESFEDRHGDLQCLNSRHKFNSQITSNSVV